MQMKTAVKEDLTEIMQAIDDMQQDTSIPKNIKNKLATVISILNQAEDLSVRLNRALHELDDVADDANIEPFTRTQVWNLVSMLESMNT